MNAKQYLDSELAEQGCAFTADDYWLLYRLWGQTSPSKWFSAMLQENTWCDGDGWRFHPLGRAAAPYSRGLYVPK